MKPLSEIDRRVIALHQSGVSINDIATETGLKRPRVKSIIEYLGPRYAKGEAMLAADSESLEGLRLTGALNQKTYSALVNATYHFDMPDLERVSDVAAQGRECIALLDGIGAGILAELDALLGRFGIAWNPRPRPIKRRTSENKHPQLRMWDIQAELTQRQETRSQFWSDIIGRVARIERACGTEVLKDHKDRDTMEGIAYRLAFLTGYVESWAEARRRGAMRDTTPEPERDDCETVGNLICLPGVKLSDVLTNGGAA